MKRARPAPAHIERAVRAFWSEALRDPLLPPDQAALASVDRWRQDADLPYALLHGPRTSRHAAFAAHLLRPRGRSRALDAHLVPVGPDTRLERDLVVLLAARLQRDLAGSSVRTLLGNLAWECLGQGRDETSPPLLVAITDVDEAEPTVRWPALFTGIGAGVKVMATVEGDETAAQAWIDRLGFDPARTLVHALPSRHDPAWEGLLGFLNGKTADGKETQAARLLGLLACAWGRLSADDIARGLGRPADLLLAEVAPWVAEVEGTYAFRQSAYRREVEARLDPEARGTWVGRLLELSPAGYPCEYGCVHRLALRAPVAAFAPLVTQDHLTRWMQRPLDGLGFVSDLERVRGRAATSLGQGADAEALGLAVRATLAEASYHGMARRPRRRAPVGVQELDRKRTLADHRAQSTALLALGRAIAPGPGRTEVLQAALDAARRIPVAEERAFAIHALASAWEDDSAERRALAREVVDAYRGVPQAAWNLLAAAPLLPPEEGMALAHEALAAAQAAGEDPGDLALFAGELPRPVAEALWSVAASFPMPSRARALAALAARIGDPDRVRAAFDVVSAYLESGSDDAFDGKPLHLRVLAPRLDLDQAGRALRFAAAFGDLGRDALQALVLRLIELGEPACALLPKLRDEEERLGVLARTLAFPSTPDRGRLRAELLDALGASTSAPRTHGERFGLFFQVAPPLAAAGATDALVAVAETFDQRARFAALLSLAQHDAIRAPELARHALSLGLALPPEDAPRLLHLVPLAPHLPRAGAAQVLARLLDDAASDLRSAALAGDSVSLEKLVPLLASLAGDQGLVAAAREVQRVAAWFP
ncbi:hypothetical protein [Sorangium sp. So ce1151]|uniref:hypothetical protein n=1 Tax=Sorangium sp. So ce1151 TaxID=3133332 RepID=UPI003F6148C5